MSNCLRSVLLVFVVLCVVSGTAAISTADDEDVVVTLPDDTIVVGEETTLGIEVTNRMTGPGETMGGTTVELESGDAPITVRTSRQSLGNVLTGGTQTAPFTVVVDQDAEPGTYELDVEITYRKGQEDPDDTIVPEGETVTDEFELEVTIEERARFEVVQASTDASVGEPGTVELVFENVGTDTAWNATVDVQSADPGFDVGGGTTFSRTFAGAWRVDETRTIRVAARASETTEARSHALDTSVRFDDALGVRRTADVHETGVFVEPKLAFTVTNVTDTLRVGKDGRVNATVMNDGNRTAENVIAVLESPNPNVAVRDPESFAGSLAPGEEARVSFRVGLREDADPGERLLPLVVRYRTPHTDNLFSDQLDLPVVADEEIDPFEVERIDRTIEQGEEIVYEIEVRNVGGERYTDIEAQLFANPPLSTTDDEAYIPELDPGETEVIAFGLEAEDDATPKTYPVSIDFRYEDELGDRHLTDRIRLSVTVIESELSPLVIVGAVVGVVLLLVGVGYWKRDQLREFLDRNTG